jgi:hypothetical protein
MVCNRCGVGGLTNCGGGNSDPVMYGFAGRAFNFIGDSGKIYNIISTLNIQVRTTYSTPDTLKILGTFHMQDP